MTENGGLSRASSPGRHSRRSHDEGQNGLLRLSFARLVSHTEKRLSEKTGTDAEFASHWGVTKEEEVSAGGRWAEGARVWCEGVRCARSVRVAIRCPRRSGD